jgi:hypothetical protein
MVKQYWWNNCYLLWKYFVHAHCTFFLSVIQSDDLIQIRDLKEQKSMQLRVVAHGGSATVTVDTSTHSVG